LPVPFLGALPSLLRVAAAIVPGLDAIRAGATLSAAVYLVLAFLAGYGALALTDKRGWAAASALASAVVAAVVIETSVPAVAVLSFGRPLGITGLPLRPAPGVIDLYARMEPGAVLDLPMRFDTLDAHLVEQPRYLLEAAYHRHSTAACYNSFRSPLTNSVWSLAARLPRRPWVAEELRSLGFANVVVHGERLGLDGAAEALAGLRELSREVPGRARLREVGVAGGHALFVLESAAPTDESLEPLAEGARLPAPLESVSPGGAYGLRFRNSGTAVFRQPMPLRPRRFEVRWTNGGGRLVRAETVEAPLPMALARNSASFDKLALTAPSEPGEYEVVAVDSDGLVLARGRVRVGD
jgi:hypothetical protein